MMVGDLGSERFEVMQSGVRIARPRRHHGPRLPSERRRVRARKRGAASPRGVAKNLRLEIGHAFDRLAKKRLLFHLALRDAEEIVAEPAVTREHLVELPPVRSRLLDELLEEKPLRGLRDI